MGRRLAGDLRRGAGITVIWMAVPALAAAAYFLLALVAAVRWPRNKQTGMQAPRPVSILKPVYGRDPNFYEAIASHASQDYPEFEILFGLIDPKDPALIDIERLQREFPE